MSFESLLTEPSGTRVRVTRDDETSFALFFKQSKLEDDLTEELDVWLETAEDETADKDLVLFGMHPVGDDTQVERLLYVRKSKGGFTGPVYSLDVDGTVVPGTLDEWAPSFDEAGFAPLK